jgi:poly(3-hydroxybutyrate) depolymerase
VSGKIGAVLIGLLLGATVSSIAIAQQLPDTTPFQERQCANRGWHVLVLDVSGMQRRVLWKGPEGPWSKGAVIVMHGGGGHHFQFCVANAPIVEPQVRFTELALAQGFAVFLLESSDRVTDNEGRLCGKVWDDEVRGRPNLDLPFIGEVIRVTIPNARPAGSQKEIFLTGLSSGGYMTLRAATHLGNLITAFALVSSGDPYGWHRVCEKEMTARDTVHGVGFDNETGKQITEVDACLSESRANEKPWDSVDVLPKPAFRAFHHRYDGVNDQSCVEKAVALLRDHHYPEVPAFLLEGDRHRSVGNHLWQDDYNTPLLEFFAAQLRP